MTAPCPCSRCDNRDAETDHYYMWWADDVKGWFWLCEACAELYQQYMTEEEEECDSEDD